MSNGKHFVAIDDMAHDLGVIASDLLSWSQSKQLVFGKDARGRLAIEAKYRNEFAYSQEYEACIKRSISSDWYGWQESHESEARLRRTRHAALDTYKQYVEELKELHISIKTDVNRHEEESAVRAAYLLLSKAITCLFMGCDSIRNGYWTAGSVIREIDESIDLARYFVVTSDTDAGKKALNKWFRQNFSPTHSECREVLSKDMASIIGDEGQEQNRLLMNELYKKKSKWVHPTFGAIREVTKFSVSEGIDVSECCVGVSDHELKLLELTDFFKSSIWSTFQAFFFCFSASLPLNREISNRLLEIDQVFQEWSDL